MQTRNTSKILTTPEAIVRAHRIRSMERRIESLQPERKPSAILERIIKVFFWIILGWGLGCLHRFLAGG